jgi:YHS domain-containing protein
MRRAILFITVLAILALVMQGVIAAGRAEKPTAKSSSITCSVMGGKVTDLKHAKKSVYKGKTYYFCCPDCKTKFDKNPAKYVKPTPSKKVVSAVCPVMGTKIPDVTKAAGKTVYKGKTYYFCCAGCKPAFDKNPEKYIKATHK